MTIEDPTEQNWDEIKDDEIAQTDETNNDEPAQIEDDNPPPNKQNKETPTHRGKTCQI